jgi:hypothetical protein
MQEQINRIKHTHSNDYSKKHLYIEFHKIIRKIQKLNIKV